MRNAVYIHLQSKKIKDFRVVMEGIHLLLEMETTKWITSYKPQSYKQKQYKVTANVLWTIVVPKLRQL